MLTALSLASLLVDMFRVDACVVISTDYFVLLVLG